MADHGIDAWVVAVEDPPDLTALSASERARAAQMRSSAAARRFANARIVLRRVLGDQLGSNPVEIELIAPTGRPPTVAGRPELAVSLSHSSLPSRSGVRSDVDLIGVAVSRDGMVGIDVEPCERARPVPYRGEPDLVAAVGRLVAPAASPVALWVAHEAFLKCLGLGLSIPFDEVEFVADAGGLRGRLDGSPWVEITLASFLAGRAVAAVARPQGAGPLQWHRHAATAALAR